MFNAEFQPLRGAYSIEASAGTGKTYSITLLWVRLLVEEGLRVDEILVSTFTKAATGELKERLLSALRSAHGVALQLAAGSIPADAPETRILNKHIHDSQEPAHSVAERLAAALSSFDLAPISTLHSFCQGLFARHAMELGTDPGQTVVQDTATHLLPLFHDELLRLSDLNTAIDIQALSRTAQAAVQNPDARLLGWDPSSDADFENLTSTLIAHVRSALEKGGHASSLAKLREGLAALEAGHPPDKLTPAQGRILGDHGTELWEQFLKIGQVRERSRALNVAQNLRTRFDAARQAAAIRSFDDLVRNVRDALDATHGANGKLAAAVRARLRAAILDECQDSDFAQIHVLSTVFNHSDTVSLLVIGDPKQSIYRFRGADLASYRNLTSQTLSAPVMTVNHRSDPALIHAINHLYGEDFAFPDEGPLEKRVRYVKVTPAAREDRIHDPARQALVVQWSPHTQREKALRHLAAAAAAECQRLLHAGIQIADRKTGHLRTITPGDVAFLASNLRELRLLREHLNGLQIPSELSGRGLGSVFDTPEANDLLIWIECLQSLQTRGDLLPKLLAFSATPLSGIAPGRIPELRCDPAFQAETCDRLRMELEWLERSGPLPALLKRLETAAVITAHLPFADGERRLTNWRQTGTLLQQQFHAGTRTAAALARWLARAIATPNSADPGESQMRLETDRPAVQLLTIHGSKGLEFPVVFCPFLWKVPDPGYREKSCTAPLVRTEDEWVLDTGSHKFLQNRDRALLQEDHEEHRKLYVALTRARHRLYLGLAPVASKKTPAGGAEPSPLIQLPGLGLAGLSPEDWLAALNALKFLQVLPASVPTTALPAISNPGEVLLGVPQNDSPQLRFGGVPHRVSSFSSLSKSGHESVPLREHNPGPEEDELPASQDLLEPLKLSGTGLGTWIHGVLEDYLGNQKSLAEALANGPVTEENAVLALETILTTPVPLPGGGAVSLDAIRDSCVTEMQFHLPVGHLNPRMLSDALLKDPAIADNPDRRLWATQLALLGFHEFTGFLQGFIDLIFEHEGRWYVVDYKSNRLDSYSANRIEQAMRDSLYLLQARLYAVALHRHLSVHLPDYDPEHHFGGVIYLFLRGLPAAGFWSEKPSPQALTQLSAVFNLH